MYPYSISELILFKNFALEYTSQYLHSRYRSSILGFLWTFLNPLLTCLTFVFLFSVIFGTSLKETAGPFFSAYLPWLFFSNSVNMSAGAISQQARYITTIRVPYLVFPLALIAAQLIDLFVGIVTLMLLQAILGIMPSLALVVLPVSVVLLTAFVIGASLVMATATVFMRDIGILWSTVITLWFFATPIIYPISRIPADKRRYFEMNPFMPFLHLFQDPLAFGRFPSWTTFGVGSVLAFGVLGAGYYAFERSRSRFYLYF